MAEPGVEASNGYLLNKERADQRQPQLMGAFIFPRRGHLTSHLPRPWSTSVLPPPLATSTLSTSEGRCGEIDRDAVGDRWRWIEGVRGEKWRGEAGEGG